jgi:hypothetical protein
MMAQDGQRSCLILAASFVNTIISSIKIERIGLSGILLVKIITFKRGLKIGKNFSTKPPTISLRRS